MSYAITAAGRPPATDWRGISRRSQRDVSSDRDAPRAAACVAPFVAANSGSLYGRSPRPGAGLPRRSKGKAFVEAGVLGPIGKHLLDRPLGLFGGRPDVFHITASARAPLYPDEPLRIVAAVGKDDDVQVADHGPRIAAGTGSARRSLRAARLFLERL